MARRDEVLLAVGFKQVRPVRRTPERDLETPYVAPGSTSRLQGKPAIAGFLATLRGVIRLADFSLLAAHPAQDAVTVLEYEGTVQLEKQGTQFHQRYVSVLRLREGRLALWREHTNPLAAQAASAAP